MFPLNVTCVQVHRELVFGSKGFVFTLNRRAHFWKKVYSIKVFFHSSVVNQVVKRDRYFTVTGFVFRMARLGGHDPEMFVNRVDDNLICPIW